MSKKTIAMNQTLKICLRVASVGVAVIAGGAFSAANAALHNFSYTGTGINASGVITTDAAGTLITGITGQRNGVAITSLLAPGSFPLPLYPNDNVFIPTGNPAFLSTNGVSFSLASSPNPLNIFFFSTDSTYRETPDDSLGTVVNATFTIVPEPSSLFGLAALTALGIGASLKRKNS